MQLPKQNPDAMTNMQGIIGQRKISFDSRSVLYDSSSIVIITNIAIVQESISIHSMRNIFMNVYPSSG